MTLILNLRGTNGSGKTTVATTLVPPGSSERLILHRATIVKAEKPARNGRKARPSRTIEKEIVGYRSDEGDILVGRYDTACGGCDGIPTIAATCDAVKAAVAMRPRAVIYEGLLASGLYQSFVDLARALQTRRPDVHVFVYLATDLEECIRRTRARTAKPPDWDDGNVRSKHRAVLRTRERAIADGLSVMDVSSTEATDRLRLMIAGVRPPEHFLVGAPVGGIERRPV